MSELLSSWRLKILENQQFNFKIEEYTHIKEFYNSNCGDKCEVFLIVKGGIVKEISYSLHGCGIQTAALEMLCSYVLKDSSKKSILKFQKEILDLTVEGNRYHCLEFVVEISNWIIEQLEN